MTARGTILKAHARSAGTPRETWIAGWFVPALVALLPLACWPGLGRPFSGPKLWVIGGLDALIVVQRFARHASWRPIASWPWLVWLAAVSFSAITGPFLSPSAFLLLVLPLPLYLGGAGVGNAVCAGSAVESAIALSQYFGHDPFRWIGWHAETFAGSRMQVYGTLGNPNFVAAWLCATLPLCLGTTGRTRIALAVLQLAAIFSTGSRVFLVALPAGLVVTALCAGRFNRRWLLALPVACALLWVSPARTLVTTIHGRLYLATVTATHLREVPLAGYGPGSFELKFAGWQDAWLREHREDARFAGPVDHAHDDYLEFWVEYGPLGLGAFLLLCGWLLVRAGRVRPPDGTLGALAALVAIACVDFPFHRPAEWALFAMLASLTRRTD